MIKSDREYRNVGFFSLDEDYKVEGYASTYEPYEMAEIDGRKFYERIDRHAFDETDMSDVVFLRDHEGRVLARTKNNSIELSVDDHGLHHVTDLGLTGASKEMYEDIHAGNYQQMSFSFVVARDHFDKETDTRVIDSIKKIYDISAVSFPANPGTEIGISSRSYFDGVIEVERAERLASEERARAKERLLLKIKVNEVNHEH